MVLKNISPGCGVQASLMLFYKFYELSLFYEVLRFITKCVAAYLVTGNTEIYFLSCHW